MVKPFAPALALITLASAACGEQPSEAEFARYVATGFKNDCLKGMSEAPNAAARQQLTLLCDCTEKKILATPMGRGDNDASVNTKVQAAANACLAEVGGVPGA